MYGLTVVTPPSAEPVTLAEAKLWAKIDATADDALVSSLITAARRIAERTLGRAFMTQTLKLSLDAFPGSTGLYWAWLDGEAPSPRADTDSPVLYLPRPPLVSVSSVQYIDGGGTLQTLSSLLYTVDVAQEYGRITPAYGQVWPVTQRPRMGAVQVTYVAGWATAADVPETVKTAIKLMVGAWYSNREDVTPAKLNELPRGAAALLSSEWHGGYA